MSDQDLLERVARAFYEEACYERHGFMPTADDDASLNPSFLRAAKVALLAADDDRTALAEIRAGRERWTALLLQDPAGED